MTVLPGDASTDEAYLEVPGMAVASWSDTDGRACTVVSTREVVDLPKPAWFSGDRANPDEAKQDASPNPN